MSAPGGDDPSTQGGWPGDGPVADGDPATRVVDTLDVRSHPTAARRAIPLVLVASPDRAKAGAVAERLRGDGLVACTTNSWQGTLRVATAVGPDILLLDPSLPPRLTRLLRAHPMSARATILTLADGSARATVGPAGPAPFEVADSHLIRPARRLVRSGMQAPIVRKFGPRILSSGSPARGVYSSHSSGPSCLSGGRADGTGESP